MADNTDLPPTKRSVLLLGNYRPALAIARALKGDGFRIIMGLGGGEGCSEYSRAVDEAWDHPELADSRVNFQRALIRFVNSRPDIAYVMPVAEEFVQCFATNTPKFAHDVKIASPDAGTVNSCADKYAFLKLAQELGIDGPPFGIAHSLADLAWKANEIGTPVIIRPLDGQSRLAGKKAIIARDAAALRELGNNIEPGHRSFLVQAYARGERQDVFFAAHDGEICRLMQVKYHRTDSLDGTGLCVFGEVIPLADDLVAATRKMVRGLDYRGIGCAQFVVDPVTRKLCLIEINPRASALHAVAEEAGLNLARVALRLANGRGGVKPDFLAQQSSGIRFAWSYGEIRAIKSSLQRGEVSSLHAFLWFGKMLTTLLSANLHLTWQWRDPIPTLMLFLKQVGVSHSPLKQSSEIEYVKF